MTYTYDPSAIGDAGLNQMRFELGDAQMDDGKAILSDEEILAALDAIPQWNMARAALMEGLARRLAFEVDVASDGMKMSLNQRAERFQSFLESAKSPARRDRPGGALRGQKMGGGYFKTGMQNNPRAGGQA